MTDLTNVMYRDAAEYTWARPHKDARIEGLLMSRLVAEATSPADHVADVGGGNGAYASGLIAGGRHVDLFDVTPEMVQDAHIRLEVATRRVGAGRFSATIADARKLPVGDGEYDVTIAFGPFYCLRERAERLTMLRELARVTKRGGSILLQTLNRTAAIRAVMNYWPALVRHVDWASFMATGLMRTAPGSDAALPVFLTAHYWSTPEEVRQELKEAGLRLQFARSVDWPEPDGGQERLESAPENVVEAWAQLVWGYGETEEHLQAGNTTIFGCSPSPAAVDSSRRKDLRHMRMRRTALSQTHLGPLP